MHDCLGDNTLLSTACGNASSGRWFIPHVFTRGEKMRNEKDFGTDF